MNGVGFEILTRTSVPQLSPSYRPPPPPPAPPPRGLIKYLKMSDVLRREDLQKTVIDLAVLSGNWEEFSQRGG